MHTSNATLLLSLEQTCLCRHREKIVKQSCKKLVEDHLSLEIQISDINTALRLGAKRLNQTADKRHNIVKFCSRDVKRGVIVARKKQNNAHICANESSSSTRNTLYDALRKMKREHPTLVKGCSTIDFFYYHFFKVYASTKPIISNSK